MEIYAIKHIISGKAYIGSTVNRKERHQTHLRMLRRGLHHCEHLQRAWNKYGEQEFVFLTICKCETVKELREVEQAFLECFFGNSLYNGKCSAIGFPAGDSHPSKKENWHQKHIRYILTDEQRKEKYGASSRGRKRDHDTYSAGAKKQWADPEQRIKKMAAMRGKRKIVTCPHCGKEGGGGNMQRYHFDRCNHASQQKSLAYDSAP